MGYILGIDLGTTNSCVAILKNGEAVIVENREGARTTPSVVAFADEILVGSAARRQAVLNPENTVSSIKRFMGRKIFEVGEEEKSIPYQIVSDKEQNVRVRVAGSVYSPQEISAFVLQKLKADAEERLGEEVKEAVITVPAYFNDAQRQATKDAGRIAGLEVKRIINEPTAAALAYGLNQQEQGTVLVFDLGGGTFDVSILEISDGLFEVLATAGDNHLGGNDFDRAIVEWLISEFAAREGVDLRDNRQAMQRLYEAAEKAKIELSSKEETTIQIPFLTGSEGEALHLETKLSRSFLNRLTEKLLDRISAPLEQAISEAGVMVDHIVLVGGMTRMPAVQEKVMDITGKKAYQGINPDEVVASGAAIQGGILEGQVTDLLLLDVTPLSLGIATRGGIMTRLIDKNTTIPTRVEEVFSTAEDNQSSVEIHVLQGEMEMASGNKSLGRFELQGIPPAQRGVPQIEVSFSIDVDGILQVAARDKGTGQSQEILIRGSSDLGEAEIEDIILKAHSYQEEDRRERELAEAKNIAEATIYNVEKTVEELGLHSPEVDSIREAIDFLVKDINCDDLLAIRQGTAELENLMNARSEKIYQEVQRQNTPALNSMDIVDAEVLHEGDDL